jgi:hypothetical protein
MRYEVEYTDEFENWWLSLSESEQESVSAVVELVAVEGHQLRFPFSSGIKGLRHRHMRELRVQHAGRPFRVLYAFDPRRAAILLIGGDKTGNDRWYEQVIPLADRLDDEHLEALNKEGEHDG